MQTVEQLTPMEVMLRAGQQQQDGADAARPQPGGWKTPHARTLGEADFYLEEAAKVRALASAKRWGFVTKVLGWVFGKALTLTFILGVLWSIPAGCEYTRLNYPQGWSKWISQPLAALQAQLGKMESWGGEERKNVEAPAQAESFDIEVPDLPVAPTPAVRKPSLPSPAAIEIPDLPRTSKSKSRR